MPGSCFYNCYVLIFELVDLHTLAGELKLTSIFYQPEKYKWNMQCNNILVYFSMFFSFSQGWKYLEDVQRSSEILKGLQK